MADNTISKIQIDDIVLNLRDAEAANSINTIIGNVNTISSTVSTMAGDINNISTSVSTINGSINSITNSIKSITTDASYKYKSGDKISMGSGTAQWIGHIFDNGKSLRFTVPVYKEAVKAKLDTYIWGEMGFRVAGKTSSTTIYVGIPSRSHETIPYRPPGKEQLTKKLRLGVTTGTYPLPIKGFVQSGHLMFEVYESYTTQYSTGDKNYYPVNLNLGTNQSVVEVVCQGCTIGFVTKDAAITTVYNILFGVTTF